MAVIYLDEHSRLRSYGAATKGQNSVVKIEIEVRDSYSLGAILDNLGRIQREQAEASAKPKKGKAKAVTHEPLLQIPFFGSTE
ncbi:MAG: hypothetical protein DI629_03570 [Mesorhizobium amorphae]|nr:MAG: hypothetical protein DI629_03570 [Mesorhizobium amorphae]